MIYEARFGRLRTIIYVHGTGLFSPQCVIKDKGLKDVWTEY